MSNRSRIFPPFLTALLLAGAAVPTQAADFLEGSGWFTRAGQKTFVAFSTECEAGQYKGYFELQDKALSLSVRSALVSSISGTGDTRTVSGNASIVGAVVGDVTAGTFSVSATDSTNALAISLSTGFSVSSALESGDIHISSLPASCGTGGADTSAPVISMFSPVDGSTVSGTTTLAANVSDNSAVAGVQFYINGSAVGPEDTTSPYSISGNSAAVANGTYTLRARARDTAGNTTSSNTLTVTVDNSGGSGDTTPPTGIITMPLNGSTVSGVVTLDVAVADNVGVAGVRYYVDGHAAAPEDTTAPYSITGNSSVVANGSHTIMARVRDTSGNVTDSALVTVTVNNANQTVHYEQDDQAVVYFNNGNPLAWGMANDADLSNHGGAESNTAGSTATFSFNGTGVTWLGFKCKCSAGIAKVYIDGTFLDNVGTYSPDWTPNAKIYSVTNLAPGNHAFKIEVTGTYDPAGETAYVLIDGFDVIK